MNNENSQYGPKHFTLLMFAAAWGGFFSYVVSLYFQNHDQLQLITNAFITVVIGAIFYTILFVIPALRKK